ncbi:DMT family transporter [Phenylobacterium sp.]|uniref:DMT family transporter n=1 Tax=Phenylobacterium sp. TaxID=1871053 RepID=UPI002CE8FC4C|nr:DMT family transporter [Phenylobacterium sp.]HLZ73396.1 DMT family transporter [Phenylobacterium sp.]
MIAPTHAAHHRNGLGIAYRMAAMVCVALLSAAVKWSGHRGVPVFEMVFFRNAFAFVPILAYIARTTGFSVLKTKLPLGHLHRSVVGLIGMTCSFSALQHLALTEATAFTFCAPLFMTALSALMLREPVGWHRWGAVVVGFVGVLIMVRPEPGHMNVAGVGFGLTAALGSALAMVQIRQIAVTEKGPTIVFYFTLAGTVLGGAVSLFNWVTPDPMTLVVLIAGGLVGGVGQLFLTEAIRVAPVGVVAPFDYSQLIWATGLGYLVWGELPHAATLAGALVVAASGIYILHRELVRFRRATVAA